MTLFELEDGHLVPAQFGHEVVDGFTPEVLDAVRAQVLEIISRPLFPITWRNIMRHSEAASTPRLTALDASGQVVAVEVLDSLDAETLIDSLSRLADTASMSWTDLASEYSGGVEDFKRGWFQFRESMPPSPPHGPRLVIVAASITEEVRPALDVLSSSGVEVHEMSLRQMSNGRAFLEVSIVGPRMYGHRANLLLGENTAQGMLEEQVIPQLEKHKEPSTDTASIAQADVLAKRKTHAHARTEDEPPSAPTRRVGVPFPSRLERRRAAHRERINTAQGPWPRSPQALEAMGASVGRSVTLVYEGDTPVEAELSAQGVITVSAGEFRDPTDALVAQGIDGRDGWDAWHIGDQYGPTLAEALTELNSQFGA